MIVLGDARNKAQKKGQAPENLPRYYQIRKL